MALKHFLALSLLFLVLCIPYLSLPLDDDAGVALMMAKGMLDGKKIYTDLFDIKGIFYYLTLIPAVLLAGTSYVKLRLIAFAILVLHAFLTYLVVRETKNEKFALLSTAVFYFLALDAFLEAFDLKPELFLGLVLTAIIYLLIKFNRVFSPFFVGLLLAYAAFIKFPFIVFVLPVLYYILKNKGKLPYFALGFSIPFLAFLLLLVLDFFSFQDYVYRVFSYAAEYGIRIFEHRISSILGAFTENTFLAQVAALFFVFFTFREANENSKTIYIFSACLFILVASGVFSQLGIYHAILLIFLFPSAFFIPLFLESIEKFLMSGSPVRFVWAAFVLFLVFETAALIPYGYFTIAKDGAVPGFNIEPQRLHSWEETALVAFIEKNTNASESINALPSLPQLYYLSSRYPPTPVLNFFAMGTPFSYYDAEKYLFEKIKDSHPKYVLIDSAGLNEETKNSTVERIREYRYRYVENIGRVEIYQYTS